LSNAVKYSPLGKPILFRLLPGEKVIRFVITDEGPGISPEEQEKLFQKFSRLSPRPTAGESSVGLGLSIARKMTEAMHGRIWCESQVGKGSRFIVEMPTVEPQGSA
jgi:signal transduction histidine kinase